MSVTELPRSVYPDARCKISVSLSSRWQNRIEQPCFLRSDGSNNAPSNTPFQDPDCASGQAISTVNNNTDTTVQKLLAKLSISYIGPHLAPVPVPKDTPRDATISVAQLLQERLRVANCFVRWSNSAGVEAVQITGVRVWSYSESDILGEVQTTYEAIDKNSKRSLFIANLNPPALDLINFPSSVQSPPTPRLHGELPTALSFEYANVELTGKFSEQQQNNQERTQGSSQPRYTRKPSKRVTRIDGDATANIPLAGVMSVQTMSVCFDIGGQTKTRSFVTEEDGAKISEINEIWGFVFVANQIYNKPSDNYYGQNVFSGDPKEFWQCLKRTHTDYLYDDQTGYLLYVLESGYNTVRYKQETADKPETLTIDSNESAYSADQYSLYSFFQIPVASNTSYQLKVMPDYAIDALSETYKVCNRDGTSTTKLLLNPDYAPPYYVEIERTESTAFASRTNPDNIDLVLDEFTKPEPDLIIGEESQFEAITTIIPGVYEEKILGSENGIPLITRGDELAPQRYVKYIKKFKAQGQAIATALEDISTETGTGNPPVAQRRPPRYQKEEANTSNQNKTQTQEQQYRYLLQTQGYTVNNPIGGTESFSMAATFEQALTAAKCKLAIENWRTGLTEKLQIPGNLNIAEGDRFNYFCNGEYRQRVVLSASTTLNILGVVDGIPRITSVTALTLGRWVLPTLTYSKIPLPRQPKPPRKDIIDTTVVSDQLGQVIDWSTVRSRRNP